MKTITLTVSVDGNEVTREYADSGNYHGAWEDRILDILDTIEKSKEVKF